jgi:beta-xylosidase
MRNRLPLGLLALSLLTGNPTVANKPAPPYRSQVWNADLGDGRYKNPILHADYSDPDVCRVGNDFYLTASSFNCLPGLPILHSNDLVHWTLIGGATQKGIPDPAFRHPQHGNGVWAPAIRYHNQTFYIYFGDPDRGIFMTKTQNPAGEWENLTLVKEGKGLIDPCPFWDDDGQAYLVHAYAGSRAGIKSLIAITKLTPDGKKATGSSKTIYDGHDVDETIEGPKLYKRNGYYYIFAPAGGVATGWQVALRSTTIDGPYERKKILAQGNTPVNGPHQGAWIDTPTGENWFIHFQDRAAYGRVVHLQPLHWNDNWPLIGEDPDGDGCGQPVLTHAKPNLTPGLPPASPVESDEFSTGQLGPQWQWHAVPDDWWHALNPAQGRLILYSVPLDPNLNLWNAPNLLLQKIPAEQFTATAKITFRPSAKIPNERAGLLVMGLDYALLAIQNTPQGLILTQNECQNADRQTPETTHDARPLRPNGDLYLRLHLRPGAICTFSYSLDGKKYHPLGKPFTAKEGKWIGAKIGLFCSRPQPANDGGRLEVDWFRIHPK